MAEVAADETFFVAGAAIMDASAVSGRAEIPRSSTLRISTAPAGIKGALTKRRLDDTPMRSTTNLKAKHIHHTIVHLLTTYSVTI